MDYRRIVEKTTAFVLSSRLYLPPIQLSGAGSAVGIATAYGLDGSESNPGGGEIFLTCPDRPWGPPNLLYNGYHVFPGGKVRPGRNADPSPPSSAEVMEEIPLPTLWPTPGL
jgi:hypothetical protein